jgi:ribosomal protein S27AE
MNETCDRCGPAVVAAYRVDRVRELYLCGRCASRHWRALSAQGWTFWPLGVHVLAPQASAGPATAWPTMR